MSVLLCKAEGLNFGQLLCQLFPSALKQACSRSRVSGQKKRVRVADVQGGSAAMES